MNFQSQAICMLGLAAMLIAVAGASGCVTYGGYGYRYDDGYWYRSRPTYYGAPHVYRRHSSKRYYDDHRDRRPARRGPLPRYRTNVDTVVVTSDASTYRTVPSARGDARGRVSSGTELKVFSEGRKFYRVHDNGRLKYIHKGNAQPASAKSGKKSEPRRKRD